MKLCIAEKPSVAKEIANILGANQRKDGYYEGNGYWVSWTFGHLCTLKEPHDYVSYWKQWNLATLPMIPSSFGIKVMENSGVQKQFRTIENLVGRCAEVINCGDAGQEGELIQRWVLHKAKNTKPVKRLWISSLTEEALRAGFDKLMDEKDFFNLYAAGSSRAIGDWLLGMNATRLYTLKFGQNRQVLSIGRVQTPTLAMIVHRQIEIDTFKSEKYWELKTNYRETLFSAQIGKLTTKEKSQKAVEYITGKPFEVTDYEQKEGTEQPPRLYDLTSIQVDANNKFAFSADHTLKLVQSLYEKKLVTYPRVDTTFLPNDMYPKIPGILKGLKYFLKLTDPLRGKPIRKSKKVFNDKKVTDHHAIIPTGISPSGISPDEQNIYNTITKRFIAAFYPDCKVSNTTVLGRVEKVNFKTTGKQIIEPGWRDVYSSEKSFKEKEETKEKSSAGEESIMPSFEKGESGPHKPDIQEKTTRPPKYYTEATLLRGMESAGKNVDDDDLRDAMKENGIGRPSTRANIIETLFRRNYIEKKKKNLQATSTGMALIKSIDNELLKSPELTGQWESKLRQIEDGTYDAAQFQNELKEMVANLTKEVLQTKKKKIPVEVKELPSKKEEKLNCPKCKTGSLLKGKKAHGCSEYGKKCDFLIPFELFGKKLTKKNMEDIVKKGKSTKIKGFKSTPNNTNAGYLILTDDFNIQFQE